MSDLDFIFAWESASSALGPWRHLHVLGLRGAEEISRLYRYEITAVVREPDPEIDPDELVRARATLRIATYTEPRFRLVHGIITEAEELGPVQGGTEYRISLSPPLARAMHRTRCRIFLEKTTRQIIDAVLQGDPELQRADGTTVEPDQGLSQGFAPARELYAWRVADSARIDDAKTRPYCVQYNESDLAFVSRLLEEEGISYHFESGDGVCLLVLSDGDVGRARLDPPAPLGPEIKNRLVSSIKLGARLRARKVSLLDYNWKKPALGMAVQEPAPADPAELVAHEYPGLYPDTPDQGKPLAAAKLERLSVEASYAVGEGLCRLPSAGTIVTIEHPKARYDGEYLVTRLEVRGSQHGGIPITTSDGAENVPYVCTFECARRGKGRAIAESHFRPARVTPKPRILGTQTAFVTAEPSATGSEIHIGGPEGAEIGCVRLRFHWDQEAARHGKEPTSGWVRVSQVFAGLGQGAVWHPRVGVEVVVDFEDGDPDRPIVIGRVYNGQNRPYTVVPTVSTFKTDTSPGGGSFNELTFDDTAGAQQIKIHTPKDWNSDAGNNRSEAVGVDSTSSVGNNRSEATGSDRSTMVGVNNAEVVGANETVTVGGNQAITIGGDQAIAIAGSQTVGIGVDQTVGIEGNQTVAIQGDQKLLVEGSKAEMILVNRGIGVTGKDALQVDGAQMVAVLGLQTTNYLAEHHLYVEKKQKIAVQADQLTAVKGRQQMTSETLQIFAAPKQELIAEHEQSLSAETLSAGASKSASIGAPEVNVSGKDAVNVSGKKLVISFTGDIAIRGANISLEGSTITLKGGKSLTIDGGAEVDVQAAVIKLN